MMDLIIKGRGHGKTVDLIKLSAETSIPILSCNPQYVKEKAKELGIDIPEPVKPVHYKEYHGYSDSRVLVDDLDRVLRFYGINGAVATITLDD